MHFKLTCFIIITCVFLKITMLVLVLYTTIKLNINIWVSVPIFYIMQIDSYFYLSGSKPVPITK